MASAETLTPSPRTGLLSKRSVASMLLRRRSTREEETGRRQGDTASTSGKDASVKQPKGRGSISDSDWFGSTVATVQGRDGSASGPEAQLVRGSDFYSDFDADSDRIRSSKGVALAKARATDGADANKAADADADISINA